MAGVLTYHAAQRSAQMGLSVIDVQAAVQYPEITYPSPPAYGAGRMISVRDELAVVHTSNGEHIITVLWRGRAGRD